MTISTQQNPNNLVNKLDRMIQDIDAIQAKFFKKDGAVKQLQRQYLEASPHAELYTFMKQFTVAIAEQATRKIMKDNDLSTRRKFMFELGIMMGVLNDALLFNDTRILENESLPSLRYEKDYYSKAFSYLKNYLIYTEVGEESKDFYQSALDILEAKVID